MSSVEHEIVSWGCCFLVALSGVVILLGPCQPCDRPGKYKRPSQHPVFPLLAMLAVVILVVLGLWVKYLSIS